MATAIEVIDKESCYESYEWQEPFDLFDALLPYLQLRKSAAIKLHEYKIHNMEETRIALDAVMTNCNNNIIKILSLPIPPLT